MENVSPGGHIVSRVGTRGKLGDLPLVTYTADSEQR